MFKCRLSRLDQCRRSHRSYEGIELLNGNNVRIALGVLFITPIHLKQPRLTTAIT